MELLLLLVLAAWVLVSAVTLAACVAAKQGDEQLRDAGAALRGAHWARLER